MSLKNKLAVLVHLALFWLPLKTAALETTEDLSPWIKSHLQSALEEYFASGEEQSTEIRILTGGYSAASLKMQVAGKTYVLRVIGNHEPPLRVLTELYAMKSAADAGIAPCIYWISADGYGILMDYVAGGTLTLEKGRDIRVIHQIGEMVRKVHALPKNPYSAPAFKEHMENFYNAHAPGSIGFATWEEAIAVIREGDRQLELLHSPSVNTHGDLNPRNILVSDQKLYFIDWSEGTFTEPFHDLGYLSAMMDYNSSEDALLLHSYLDREPTVQEKKRFLLSKKMNFARLALGGQFIGNKLHAEKQEVLIHPQPLMKWSFYAEKFANQNILFSPDHFWNMAKAALVNAAAIEVKED